MFVNAETSDLSPQQAVMSLTITQRQEIVGFFSRETE